MPHISYFDSIPNLIWKLETDNHRERSRSIQKQHAEHLGVATLFWSEALEQVATLRGVQPKEVPEESVEASSPPGPSADELRDLSTRQQSGGSTARHDGPHRMANDGETRQDHPFEYHFDLTGAAQALGRSPGPGMGGSHWWVRLRRPTSDPEVKLWTRNCCCEAYGNRLWLLLGNSSDIDTAAECAVVEAPADVEVSTVCHGAGEYLFVEARPVGGRGYQDEGTAVLMLPEVRVLCGD
ncbi:unnamed protein product [Polarella glacialis]|uniref:Uncharacterized protein n=1 Tax=Polarella glacialis TaxID=89957 RepID=A0A813K798_POLGL|nr:unnamed protein product [Polarella glacialis]